VKSAGGGRWESNPPHPSRAAPVLKTVTHERKAALRLVFQAIGRVSNRFQTIGLTPRERISKRLDAIEAEIRELRSSLESLRRDLTAQMASQFRWVVGLWATTILAVLGLYLRR
jgi:hypothetical protein